MPIAAAELDDPIREYDVEYGDDSVSLTFNKYTGELFGGYFSGYNGCACAKYTDNRENEDAYTFTAEDILAVLNDPPQDGIVTEKTKKSQETKIVTNEAACQFVDNHSQMSLTISKTADQNDPATGFSSPSPTSLTISKTADQNDASDHDKIILGCSIKMPKWAKIVATAIVVALVVGAVVAASTGHPAVAAACLGTISAVSLIDKFWDDD